MADNPKTTIVIEVDLDEKSLEQGIAKIDSSLDKGTSKSAAKAEKNLTAAFSSKLVGSINSITESSSKLNSNLDITSNAAKSVNNSLNLVVSTATDMSSKLNLVLDVVALLESRFKILSNTLSMIGIDTVKLIAQFHLLTKAIIGLATGQSSINDVKIETGLFLKELGLVDNKLLSMISTFRTTVNFVRGLVVDVKSLSIFLSKMIPVVVGLEEKFGLVTLALNKFNVNIEDVVRKVEKLKSTFLDFKTGEKSFFDVKLAAASLLGELGLIDKKLALMAVGALKVKENVGDIAAGSGKLALVGGASAIVVKNFDDLAKTSGKLKDIIFKGKGLFNFTSTLASIGAGFALLNKSVQDSESAFGKLTFAISGLGAVFFGGLAAGIGFAIVKLSELGQIIGNKLVGFFIDAAKSFNVAEQELAVFGKVVENFDKLTLGNVGTIESWEGKIEDISSSFNVMSTDVRKSAQEIIAVTSQMGFNEDQMKKLLKVSTEYAKVNKKDVFETTVGVVAALNGQAQSVEKLGIKLGAASVQQFAYKKGLTQTLDSMTDNEKIQLRYNKLLSQYKTIAGIAAESAGTLADQNKRYEINVTRLTTALGAGARLIEQNNILAGLANLALNNLNDGVFKVVGAFGALGSRVVQVGAFLLEWSFKLFAVIKAVKILDVLLKSQQGMKAFSANIPLVNKSLNQMISSLSGAKIEVSSLKSLLSGFKGTAKGGLSSFLQFISGHGLKGATIMGVLRGAIVKLGFGLSAAASALTAFIAPLLPYIAIGAAVAGVFVVIYKAVQTLEERTQFLATTWSILSDTIMEGSSVFQPVIKFFTKLKEITIELAYKGFGLIVTAFTKIGSAVAALGASNPFGVFGKDAVAKFAALEQKMNGFSSNLIAAKFDMRNLGDEISRKPAGKSFIDVNLEELAKLRKELKDFSTNEFQRIKELEANRLSLLEAANAKGLLAAGEYELLKGQAVLNAKEQVNEQLLTQLGTFHQSELEKINLQEESRLAIAMRAFESSAINKQMHETLMTQIHEDAANQRAEIDKKEAKNRQKTMGNLGQGLVNIMSQTMQMLGKGLIEGGSSFKQFLGIVLNVFGDMAISIGTTALASIQTIQAMKASIATSGAMGVALALGLIGIGAAMKAAGSAMGGSGGVSAAGSVGGGGGIASSSGGQADIESGQFVEQKNERAKQQNVINLTVEGNVVDSEEEGTRIAKVLQKSFNKEGVVLNNPRTA